MVYVEFLIYCFCDCWKFGQIKKLNNIFILFYKSVTCVFFHVQMCVGHPYGDSPLSVLPNYFRNFGIGGL